jgi:hypothetical protein
MFYTKTYWYSLLYLTGVVCFGLWYRLLYSVVLFGIGIDSSIVLLGTRNTLQCHVCYDISVGITVDGIVMVIPTIGKVL